MFYRRYFTLGRAGSWHECAYTADLKGSYDRRPHVTHYKIRGSTQIDEGMPRMKCRQMRLRFLYVLGAILLSQMTSSSGAWAGSTVPMSAWHLQLNQVVTVRQAETLCQRHPGNYHLTLQGMFLLQMSPALVHRQGGLFDTDELPSSAGGDPTRYRGMVVEVSRALYRTRRAPPGPVWIRAQGLLECRPLLFELYGWHQAKSRAPEQIPTLGGILTPHAARHYCASHTSTRVRVTVHGYYVATTTSEYVTGSVYEDRRASRGDTSKGLHVEVSIKGRVSTVMPSSSTLVIRGLLDCMVRPYQLQAYGWQE